MTVSEKMIEAGLQVKWLEWEEIEADWFGANFARNSYEVRKSSRGAVRVRVSPGSFESFDGTMEAAILHMNDLHREMILSALEAIKEPTHG